MNTTSDIPTADDAKAKDPAPIPSAAAATVAIVIAVFTIPGSRWLADQEPFLLSFLKWPTLVLGIIMWSVAAKRWAPLDRASKFIAGFYVVLGLSYLFLR